ncbi:MAG: Outer membrane protein (porin) [Marinobacter excellens HL-55]|uniref:Outer membrane protein (Porin) n=1 Tax=Marinobacter excellens HL-55 TaxID=1305731 RepID=A0A0P7ZF68_9GAMM|nr:MAG: Outer membrane protein (porin) [Marinobacter excellens HL-55]
MKKTILASAIAAATFSGAVMAQESNLPTVYGNIQYAIAHDNVDGGPSAIEHFDNGSTLGVTHEHQIAPGITGFFKIELEGINADDKSASNGIDGLDEAYIGIKGDSFGQLWVGSDDSTYESAVDEIAQFYEVATLSIGAAGYSTGEGDLIQYLSPNFGGLTVGAAVQVNGDNDNKGTGQKSYPFQLAAMYNVDALELAFAVDSNDNGGDNENTYGLRASYNLDNLRVTGEYHTRKDAFDKFGLMGVYTLGKNQFALSYEMAEADNSDSTKWDTITLQALHNVSDHMYVYFEGYIGGGDDVYDYNFERADSDDFDASAGVSDERAIAAVGAVYYF